MDVDEDEQGSQDIKSVPDYGIEVDFESLDEDQREVRAICSCTCVSFLKVLLGWFFGRSC